MRLTKILLLAAISLCVSGVALPQIIGYPDSEGSNDVVYINAYPEDTSEFDQTAPTVNSCLNNPVTISLTNKSLKEILKEISLLTKTKMVFNEELINQQNFSVEAEDKPLKKVLDELFAGTGISYVEYKMGQIVLGKEKKIAEKTGSIKGIVRDEKGETLPGANVVVLETGAGCTTNAEGKYYIKNLKPGKYNLKVSFISCESFEQEIIVVEGKIIELDFTLTSTSFQIGGIEVVGNSELIPTDVSTKTVINSGEIEHYQASSIKDVLDLVPGVQKTDNPGLSKTSQIAIRGDESNQSSAFGTLVVLDGAPVSNNANLQFERSTDLGVSNLGGGVDLRTIPADNIESIEVITGLPSVKYGDVTEGVINVKTKIGRQPHRLKLKNNPDTREANLGGGWLIGQSGLSYNVNVARSERDVRKDGDEYTRFTAQTVYSKNFPDINLSTNHKLSGQAIYDEEEPKGDVYQTKNYNRGFSIGFTSWGKYVPADEVSSYEYNFHVNMRRENSMKSKLVQADLHVLPNGDTISTYLGKLETKGIEWTVDGRLEWNYLFYTGNFVHKILAGTEIQYNANTGEGLTFDTLYNPYGLTSGRRPYSFSSIPGQLLPSLYFEDKITGHLLYDFSLMVGARYEMYRPFQFSLKGLWGDGDLVKSHQGTFFNPRANLMVYFSQDNQLRLSAGRTSKSPAMSTIYPDEEVFRWRNPNSLEIHYMRYDTRVPELKGYQENQYEISYDQKFFSEIGLTFSAYYKERDNETRSVTIPVFVNTPQGTYYVDYYGLAKNQGWTVTKGLELSLRTNKIKPLNMFFQVSATYNHSNNSYRGYAYDPTPDASIGQNANYRVGDTLIGFIYAPSGRWKDIIQLNYYLKYTLPDLGLWVTLRAEHLVMERTQSYNQEPIVYELLTESGKESYWFDREIKIKNAKWLFNLNISKSLFEGAEISFYVNNFLDDQAVRQYVSSPGTISEEIRNPSLFYGIEFSSTLDNLFK
ncbi:MAG: hypothetical protein C4539_12385 [Ignavibacteriales bacterium]|nr:MAG: hypothetical protein C4539_12385 [Ignavibacteriales bacterium]